MSSLSEEKLKIELKEHKNKIKDLEHLLEIQDKELHSLRDSKFELPDTYLNLSTKKDFFCRVIIPDVHGSISNKDSMQALFRDLEILKPSEIIIIGDFIDCGGFLAQHHTMGYVSETEYSFQDDVTAGNTILDIIQNICPNTRIDMLEGNHERRIEAWIVTQTLRHKKDAKFLSSIFSTESCLSLNKRKIELYKQGQFYDGLGIPSTIKRNDCYYNHGTYTCKAAAIAHLNKFGGNVVFGHTHRAESVVIRTVNRGVIGAWNPGCLSNLQPLWKHTDYTNWSNGYGVQAVLESTGHFMHINIPIINGESYLQPLLLNFSQK